MDRAGRHQETRQRPDRGRLRRPQLADRWHQRGLPRRHAPGAEEPYRLRAPVRAPDVPGFAECQEGCVRQRHHWRWWPEQRQYASGLHQLHRGRAGVRAGADPVAGSRPHEDLGLQPGNAEEPAGRGEGGDPRQREEPALWRVHVDRHRPAGLQQVGKQPRRLWQLRGSGKRQPRGRGSLPPRLLRPEQCRARHRR